MLKRIVCTAALLASTSTFAAETAVVTGSLPRNLGAGTFKLTAVIKNITPTEWANGTADGESCSLEAFKKRVAVKLPGISSTDELFTTSDEALANSKEFYVEQEDCSEDQQGDGTDNITVTYNMTVAESGFASGALETRVNETNADLIRVSFFYYLGDGEVSKAENVEIKQETYVINAAPSLTSIVGTNRSLRINWDVATAVAIKGGSGEKAPAQVNAFVVDRNVATSLTFASRKFEPSNESGDPEGAGCTYTDPGTTSGACVTCPTDEYLDYDAIKDQGLPGVRTQSDTNATGFALVANLDNASQYMAFLQYEPSGLQVSTCMAGQPSPDTTLTEANGEGEAEIVDFRCFIATAAYGTQLHEDLAVFRQFRDHVLMRSAPGRALVAVYYEHGPTAARYVAARPRLKAFVRAGLEVVADLLR